jgi:hypothetical protein
MKFWTEEVVDEGDIRIPASVEVAGQNAGDLHARVSGVGRVDGLPFAEKCRRHC